MKRRILLGGIGGLAIGGYALWPDIRETPVEESGIVPYLGDEITFNGDGRATDEFEIEKSGPTVLFFEHTGEDRVFIELINRKTGHIRRLMDFVGSETVRTLHTLPVSSYKIRIRGSPSEWSLSLSNYDVHQPDDRQTSSLPLTLDGSHYYAVGPIHFDPVSDVEFVMRVENGGSHRVGLYDEQGVFVNDVFRFQSTDVDEQEFVIRLNGVGYLSIETASEWSLSISHR